MTDHLGTGPGEPVRATSYGADRSYVRCSGEGEQVVLAFPYDAALVGEAKAIGGRHFDWQTKTNIFPFDRLPQVVAFADAHGIDVAPQVRSLVRKAATLVRQETAASPAQATREAAHLYLRHGLLPVPAWAAWNDGTCRCPRAGACARPGKHPRSVHVGPGLHDYSWRPLACSTDEEVEQRFAHDGKYAGANLMLAIPEGMLVIDQDNDDGGRQAVAALADRLGELPATLGHGTPHGMHRIYRTPAGWTTRAWVGKDHRNPLPAGVDLRVPGQILMAPPSRVPATDGLAPYGPVAAIAVADLPSAYISAWTPPKDHVRMVRPRCPVPPSRADVAASYVHARVTGIVADMAALKPGGRNTAIYTAALKVGSTLGAARSTPGAEHAAAAWTDESAEEALMTAAEHNGYIAEHSAAAARAAIRSGLRNGLRDPWPLPELGSRQTASGLMPQGQRAPREPGTGSAARPESASRNLAASHEPDTATAYPPEASGQGNRPSARSRHRGEPSRGSGNTWFLDNVVRAGSRDIAVAEPTTTGHVVARQRASNEPSDWRDTAIGKQRQIWQPQVMQPEGPPVRPVEANGQQIST